MNFKRENARLKLALASISLAGLVAGCATHQAHEAELDISDDDLSIWLSDKPEEIRHLYAMVPLQGPRNLVLNQMRAGLAAFELGAWETAERSFDEALNVIETIYADNPDAAAARSNFTRENIKDFKGEPYERAMAYYYRGLLYLRRGDYENARASFRGGMLQDTMAEDDRFSQDFASLAYLEGWASRCNGDHQIAGNAFTEAQGHRPGLQRPGGDENVLVIYESGLGPIKAALGQYRETLAIAEGPQPFLPNGPQLLTPEEGDKPFALAEDIFWQATTRGGREADNILIAKAEFKEGMETTSIIMTTMGLSAMNQRTSTGQHNSDMATAGAALAVGGMIAGLLSGATTAEADARYWDNLPGQVWLTAVEGSEDGLYLIQAGNAMTVAEASPMHNCSIAWAREQSYESLPARAPNSSALADASNVTR